MSEKEVLQTMETLMSSMSSGDWGNIMPDQFYSLIDNLQEIEGLDQNDIDQLEESYTQYLKLQGTFDDLEDDVELKPELLQPSHAPGGFSGTTSPHHSPYGSPVPPHQSPLMQNADHSPSGSINHSRNSPLLDSNSLNNILQRNMYSKINMTSASPNMSVPSVVLGSTSMLQRGPSPNMNVLTTSPNVNLLGSSPNYAACPPMMQNGNKRVNASHMLNHPPVQAPMYHTGTTILEDEEDTFDWEAIM